MRITNPFDKGKYINVALKILSPIKPANKNTIAQEGFLFHAKRSIAGQNLEEYYLIYFLLSDLLGFHNLGQFEKVAWSFPIDYKGKGFLVEHRKLGVGLFVQDIQGDEEDAKEIVEKINKAIKNVRPFYDYLADEAIKKSELNVINNNENLYSRFKYLLSIYKKEYGMYVKNRGKVKITSKKTKLGESTPHKQLDFQYRQKANWVAISCIEAFFSWTEHLFIHLAIVAHNVSNGIDITNMIGAEWKDKFKLAIPYETKEVRKFYNELLLVRQQLRNFVAHGAFGKDGNAFLFHSKTGAVPVLMDHKKQKNRFSLHGYLTFKEENVIELIEHFVQFLFAGPLAPAMYYSQILGLPTVLTYSADGTYKTATKDMKSMKEFTDF